MNTQNIKSLYINKLTLEDMELGVGEVTQTRGGKQVVRTKINAKNFPFDENRTLAQRLDAITEDLNKAESYVDLFAKANLEANKTLNMTKEYNKFIKNTQMDIERIAYNVNIVKTEILAKLGEASLVLGKADNLYKEFKNISLSMKQDLSEMIRVEYNLNLLKERFEFIAEKVECVFAKAKQATKELREMANQWRELSLQIPEVLEAAKKACECAKKACECASRAAESEKNAKASEETAFISEKHARDYLLGIKDLIKKNEKILRDNMVALGQTYIYTEETGTAEHLLIYMGKITDAEYTGGELKLTHDEDISLFLNDEGQLILAL